MLLKRDNFKCSCCGIDKMQNKHLVNLNKIIGLFPHNVILTSGYRCIKHNKNVGGVPTSKHTRGLATDLAPVNPENLQNLYILCLKSKLFDEVILYKAKKFVHIAT